MASRRPLVRASGGNRQLPSGDTLDASVTGNAATATKLATARTLSWSGDVTGSTTYDGSANSSAALTLAASGVAAGTYGGVTVNAKGLVTAGTAISPATQSALDGKVSRSNASVNGFMTISRTDSYDTGVDLQSPAGTYRYFSFKSGQTSRWYFGVNSSAESGSNVGSDFYISRYADDGSFLGFPFQIARGTGLVTQAQTAFSMPVRLPTYTLTTLPSASAFNGYQIAVSNASRGWALCRSNGTSWIDLYTQAAVA